MKSPHNFESHNRVVRGIFSRIAGKYDLMNQVISFGQADSWRTAAIEGLEINSGEIVIDLALRIKTQFPENLVVGVDLTPEMLKIARTRDINHQVHWVIADAHFLPFQSECCQKIVSAYLLRNVSDMAACIQEQFRLLLPHGKAVALETSPPGKSWLAPLASVYLNFFLPFLGGLLANDYQAYKYLSDSTRNFVKPQEIVKLFEKARFHNVRAMCKMFSTIVILSADKP